MIDLDKKAIRFADLVVETNKKYGHCWNMVAAKMENQKWVKLEDAKQAVQEALNTQNKKETT